MTTPQNTSADQATIRVTASTDNPNDQGYHHCFEQKDDATLVFELDTDPSVDTINFVLWKLHDPANPKIAKSMDPPVQNGHATITLSHHLDEHLGPGPYCATLTASSPTAASAASMGARKIVGNTVYYYETWKGSRDCKYAKSSR
jgi:hypothetical protein